ncbi:hypothetical protein D3C86_1731190 [compost metagenome]
MAFVRFIVDQQQGNIHSVHLLALDSFLLQRIDHFVAQFIQDDISTCNFLLFHDLIQQTDAKHAHKGSRNAMTGTVCNGNQSPVAPAVHEEEIPADNILRLVHHEKISGNCSADRLFIR